MSRILIVEDERIIRAALRRLLEKNHYDVSDASSVDEAASLLAAEKFDLIISDLRLPGAPGTDLIAMARKIPVLIMTSYASLRSAVDAMKLGAVDYIAKPFDHDEMLNTIHTITHRTASETPDTDTPAAPETPNMILGNCEAIQELHKRIAKVARTDATVLVLGESGTGKELAARAIHQQSKRASAPMICVNCAAIPESLIESELFGHEKGAFTGADTSRSGLIEAADKGTLFLDEIGELPLEAQARLLRFLQEGEIRRVGAVQSKKVDVRLIAATHRDLKSLARVGQFREDLYYRLYVMELKMPPLRERGKDIPELAKLFLERHSKGRDEPLSFSKAATDGMLGYAWPGNVRELENAIERAVILVEGNEISADLLGLEFEKESLDDLEQSYAHRMHTGQTSTDSQRTDLSLDDYFQRFVMDNQEQMSETELAKTLGISRKCLWERRQKLGIPRKVKSSKA
ncbi:sigma-54-dependent transcriptional regulator [Nitrincola sp. MINF-07-Sa-05]|uniref:sigma-54-dependent transcriptional regulator n=1 Tax=Nitrincola salilacus TaxID=3400273 RepID=UPI0039184FE9